jgi:hypothetical protein
MQVIRRGGCCHVALARSTFAWLQHASRPGPCSAAFGQSALAETVKRVELKNQQVKSGALARRETAVRERKNVNSRLYACRCTSGGVDVALEERWTAARATGDPVQFPLPTLNVEPRRKAVVYRSDVPPNGVWPDSALWWSFVSTAHPCGALSGRHVAPCRT